MFFCEEMQPRSAILVEIDGEGVSGLGSALNIGLRSTDALGTGNGPAEKACAVPTQVRIPHAQANAGRCVNCR